MMMSYFAHLD